MLYMFSYTLLSKKVLYTKTKTQVRLPTLLQRTGGPLGCCRLLLFIATVFSVLTLIPAPLRANEAATKSIERPFLLPDFFICHPDPCNNCRFDLKQTREGGYTFSHQQGNCTQVGCSPTDETTEKYNKCMKNWALSDHIGFHSLTPLENACVNGVRNRSLNFLSPPSSNFPAPTSQKQNSAITSRAYELCKNFFINLKKEFGFTDSEMKVLAKYLRSGQFPLFDTYVPTTLVRGEKKRDIDILRNIFVTLKETEHSSANGIITPQLREKFFLDYAQRNSNEESRSEK